MNFCEIYYEKITYLFQITHMTTKEVLQNIFPDVIVDIIENLLLCSYDGCKKKYCVNYTCADHSDFSWRIASKLERDRVFAKGYGYSVRDSIYRVRVNYFGVILPKRKRLHK